MLATKDFRVSNYEHLEDEKVHLLGVFERNGYSKHQGLKVFLNAGRGPKQKKYPSELDKVAFNFHLSMVQLN